MLLNLYPKVPDCSELLVHTRLWDRYTIHKLQTKHIEQISKRHKVIPFQHAHGYDASSESVRKSIFEKTKQTSVYGYCWHLIHAFFHILQGWYNYIYIHTTHTGTTTLTTLICVGLLHRPLLRKEGLLLLAVCACAKSSEIYLSWNWNFLSSWMNIQERIQCIRTQSYMYMCSYM